MDSRAVRRLILVTCMAAALGRSAVLAQPPPDYKPSIGMPGKDVVWVPNPAEMVDKMLDFAGVTAQDFVVDLGSGDGRNVIGAARRGARALGVEFNPDLVEFSKRTAATEGVGDKASFVQGDMFEADVSKATVLVLFLLPDNLRKLTPKFLTLEPGSRIVANTFAIPGWDPDVRERAESDCLNWCEMMLWIVPAQVAGSWRLTQGTVTFQQEFQKLSGNLTSRDETTPVVDGKLKGREIEFSLGGVQYTGRVNGDTIEGTRTAGERQERFSARRIASQ
jgi:SAM-dependent methyltransferase